MREASLLELVPIMGCHSMDTRQRIEHEPAVPIIEPQFTDHKVFVGLPCVRFNHRQGQALSLERFREVQHLRAHLVGDGKCRLIAIVSC